MNEDPKHVPSIAELANAAAVRGSSIYVIDPQVNCSVDNFLRFLFPSFDFQGRLSSKAQDTNFVTCFTKRPGWHGAVGSGIKWILFTGFPSNKNWFAGCRKVIPYCCRGGCRQACTQEGTAAEMILFHDLGLK